MNRVIKTNIKNASPFSVIRYVLKKDYLICSKTKKKINGSIIKKGNGSRLFFNVIDEAFPLRESALLYVEKNANIVFSGRCVFASGCKVAIYNGSTLLLNNCFVNSSCKIISKKRIEIKSGSFIGPECIISDTDYHTINGRSNSKEIIIEENVWIGQRCQILKGVHIGEGSVVAAGSIVTNDIPPNCLYGGAPARLIKKNINWHV